MGMGPNAGVLLANEDGTLTETEALKSAGVTPGVVTASKALVAGASGELDALTITALIATTATIASPTFTNPPLNPAATGITAHAGGAITSAVALTKAYNNVTVCASNFDSVKLPVAALGKSITVKNSGAAILSVFPVTGSTINALAASLSVDIPVGGEVTFNALSATAWSCKSALSSSAPSTQKGTLVFIAADSAGNTQTKITNASMAAARTLTIPDPGADADFMMATSHPLASIATASTPAAGTNTTQFTLKDGAAVALAVSTSGVCYLSSDSAGQTPVGATTSAAAAVNGTLVAIDAGKKLFQYIAKSDGTLGILLTSNAGTYYWNFILPSGKVITSSAIVVN